MNGPLPAMKSSMIVVEWKVGSPYGFDMGMAVVVVCMAGPPIENAVKKFSQTFQCCTKHRVFFFNVVPS